MQWGEYSQSLLKSVDTGDAEEVSRLVAAGAKPDGLYRWGYPIFRACDLGHLGVIRTLVKLGADVNVLSEQRKGTPLASASAGSFHLPDGQNLAVVDLLLDLGANPEIMTIGLRRHVTPLHIAISRGQQPIACRLLERGASPDKKDSFGNDAIDYAVYFDANDVVALLLELKGQDCESRLNSARSAKSLWNSVERGDRGAIQQALVEGADINKVSVYERDALYYAADKSDLVVTQLLLDHGADPNNLHDGQTPLMAAASHGARDLFELLLSAGADIFAEIEMAPGKMMTVAHFAKSGGHRELADFITKEMKNRKRVTSE
jgi:uncharacterized protein